MLDVDTFLTALYVMVDDFCHSQPPKGRPGPQASLSNSDVITLAIFARWGRFASERDFYRYARRYLREAFPTLPDRSQFNRLVRSRVGIIEEVALHLALVPNTQDAACYEALDTSAMPVRDAKRRSEGGWLAGYAVIGWSNSLGWYEGFSLLVAVHPTGWLPAWASPPLPPRTSRWPKPSSPCGLKRILGSRARDRRPRGRTWSTRASFDLAAEVTRLREEKAWKEGRRNAITLRKGDGLNVVLLVMKEGDRLDEHSAPGPITLSEHEGRIRLSASDEDVEAEAGTMLACDAGVRHSVEALGEAVCLLNVATGSGRRGLG